MPPQQRRESGGHAHRLGGGRRRDLLEAHHSTRIVDRGEIFPSLAVDPGHPGTQELGRAFGAVTGSPASVDMSGTVTDGGWFGHYRIPACIFGPGQLAQAHGVDESVELGQLVTFAQVIARFVAGWCNTPRG